MPKYQDIINTGLEQAASFSDGNWLEQLLVPGQVQEREFGQQVALQQMQNEWNSEQEKMRRLKEAGVNPLTAAQGVSGSGQSPATSSVPGQAVTSPPSDVGAAVSGIGQGVEAFSKSKETRKLLDNRNKNLVTDTFLKLKEAGYQDALAKNLSIATMFLPQEKMLNLMAMAAEVPKINAEYNSIMQGIDESKERIKEIDARIKLAEATANYQDKLALEAEKRTLQIQVQTDMDNWRLDKMKRLNLDPNNPIESNMFTMACEGNQDLVDKGAAVFRDIEYNKSTGAYDAEEEHAYDIAYDKERAAAEATWLSRPNNIPSLLVQDVAELGKLVRNHKIKRESAEIQIKQKKLFQKGFKEMKDHQLKEMQTANHEYRKLASKYGRNSDVAKKAKYKAISASNVYHSYDEDDYVDLLFNQVGDRSRK